MEKSNRGRLFAFMHQVIENRKCKPFIINGIEDHLHILTSIHQTVPIASLVKDVKLATNRLIKDEELFPAFECWQEGYSVFSYSRDALDNLFRYVKFQEEHHHRLDYKVELTGMLDAAGIQYDEKFLFV